MEICPVEPASSLTAVATQAPVRADDSRPTRKTGADKVFFFIEGKSFTDGDLVRNLLLMVVGADQFYRLAGSLRVPDNAGHDAKIRKGVGIVEHQFVG